MARPTPPPRELTYVPLARIGEDTTFRLRHPGDISSLARSIAQAGQLFAIEVRPIGEGFQAITGFRRLAALRLLFRDRVLVRVHQDLADESAALVAAADALDSRPLERDELLEMRERYRSMGWSTPALEELIARAIEVAEERLEDLSAQLRGLPPPDRSVPDEDAIDPDDLPPAERKALAAAEAREAASAEASAEASAAQANAAEANAAEANAAEASAAEANAAEASAGPHLEDRAEAPPEGGAIPAEAASGQAHADLHVGDHAGSSAEPVGSELRQPPAEPPGSQPLAMPRQQHAEPQAHTPRELTAAELAEDAAKRLSLLTQDLAILAAHWNEVPAAFRTIVSEQIDYYRQLGAWLERPTGDQP